MTIFWCAEVSAELQRPFPLPTPCAFQCMGWLPIPGPSYRREREEDPGWEGGDMAQAALVPDSLAYCVTLSKS